MIEIESTPDSGVEIKNAEVDALLAPDFFNDTAVGMTEHEQRGSGTPIIEALITAQRLFPPNHLLTCSSEIKALINPASKNPNIKYGADVTTYFHNELINSILFHQILKTKLPMFCMIHPC